MSHSPSIHSLRTKQTLWHSGIKGKEEFSRGCLIIQKRPPLAKEYAEKRGNGRRGRGVMRKYKKAVKKDEKERKKMRMAMRNWWGVVRSRGRVVGLRHMQVRGESGREGAAVGGAAAATEEEAGKGPEMAQQDKAYSSSSPQDHHHSKERPRDKPQPSPRVVRQNAKLVKDSMNTKNI